MEPTKKRRRGKRSSKQVLQQQVEDQEYLDCKTDVQSKDQEDLFFGRLRDETAQYFKSIEPMVSSGDDLMIENIYDEVNGAELIIATDFSGSRFLERVVQKSNAFQLRVLLERFRGNYVNLMKHRFACHVMQVIVQQVQAVLFDELSGQLVEAEGLPKMQELYGQLIQDVIINVKSLATDRFGSHVLKTLLVLLAGPTLSEVERSEALVPPQKSIRYIKEKRLNVDGGKVFDSVSEHYKDQFMQLVDVLSQLFTVRQICEMALDTVTSPVLSVFLVILSKTSEKQYLLICQSLLDSPQQLAALITSPCGSYILQVSMKHPKTRKNLCRMMREEFIDEQKLMFCCMDNYANYVVQSYLEYVTDQDQASLVVASICSPQKLQQLLFNRMNIIVKIIGLSVKFDIHEQDRLALNFKTMFDGRFDKLLCLNNEIRQGFSMGCQLAAALFSMKHKCTSWLSESLFIENKDYLSKLAYQRQSSKVLQAIFINPLAAPKSKHQLFAILKADIANLAMDKSGSYLVEAMFTFQELRQPIMKELVKHQDKVETSLVGKKLLQSFNVKLYRQSPDKWRN